MSQDISRDTNTEPFVGFPKIYRYSREVVVTEKIDGTNAQLFIGTAGEFMVGSRNRWITPEDDNYGFARWANAHKEELITGLGEGRHFGEWWGKGIQRGYGLDEKRFSLFNVVRWADKCPECCHVVPELWRGFLDFLNADEVLAELLESGSRAAPGFLHPEGIVIYHDASGYSFKKTIEKDGGKGI